MTHAVAAPKPAVVGWKSTAIALIEGMLDAVGPGKGSYCTSCYTGQYPVEFPRNEAAYLQLTLKPVEERDKPLDQEPDPVVTP